MYKNNLMILFLLVINMNVNCLLRGSNTKIYELDIFYETLCPFSREFITDKVQEVLKSPSLRKSVKINFHPFGKGADKSNGTNFKFTCQHGVNECFGNKIQLCGLKQFNYDNGVNFIVCMESAMPMTNFDMSSALYSCAPGQIYKDIMKCAYGVQGDLLMHQESIKNQQPSIGLMNKERKIKLQS